MELTEFFADPLFEEVEYEKEKKKLLYPLQFGLNYVKINTIEKNKEKEEYVYSFLQRE